LEANLKAQAPGQTIIFAGSVRYAEVPALLREHDVFLLTSDYEGLPLSLLEAMGQGLVPVVSALKSGIPEVVDNSNGLLVAVNDVPGYARAIVQLHAGRDLLAAKSFAARVRVKRDFSVAAMTDRWLAVMPAPQGSDEIWPKRWHIQGPLLARNPIYYSAPVRLLRRAAVRLRH
jgi:glycosyltransferase involved in cell wall biosynthesis